MHKYLLLLICILSFSGTFCQSLEGEWEGWYTYKNNNKDTAIIKLQFQLKKDSTYDVYSFTKLKNYKAVCKMTYKMLNSYSIYLEETELIRVANNSTESLFQKMTLKFENGFKSMKGKWFYKDVKLKYSGNVAFAKKT